MLVTLRIEMDQEFGETAHIPPCGIPLYSVYDGPPSSDDDDQANYNKMFPHANAGVTGQVYSPVPGVVACSEQCKFRIYKRMRFQWSYTSHINVWILGN